MLKNYDFIDFEYLDMDAEIVLDSRFKYALLEFEKNIKSYKYNHIEIDKYNYVYVIDNKYAIFIGLLYEPFLFVDEDEYSRYSDASYINQKFSIIIEELIYDNNLNINVENFVNKLNDYFDSEFVKHYEVHQYFMRKYDDTSSRFDDDDKFHTLAKKVENKIDLYDLLEKNQKNQNISDNYDIDEAIKYFEDVICLFTNEIKDFNYVIYVINKYEKVYLIEDSLIMYVGLKGSSSLFRDKVAKNGTVFDRYSVVFQELTYNELFNQKRFSKMIKQQNLANVNSISFWTGNRIYYRPFLSGDVDEKVVKGYKTRIWQTSNYEYVDKNLPQLNLKERYESWDGFQYYFIVYELNVNNKVGIAVTRTTDIHPSYMARTLIKDYENYKTRSYDAFSCDNIWTECMNILLDEAKKNNWENVKRNSTSRSLLAEKVTYYVVPKFIKNKNNLLNIQEETLKEAKNNKYAKIERQIYDLVDYKWKSEELVYKCVKQIFKNKEVIHQHRPYFLHTGKSQLSYDVYVCGERIAFEYQGKQHFEPVEIFGGKDNYEKQLERDKLKKELSEKNNIKLIYINYWEDINVDLIKKKLNEYN